MIEKIIDITHLKNEKMVFLHAVWKPKAFAVAKTETPLTLYTDE